MFTNMTIFWLVLCGIFMFIEILTTGFLIFWLGVGALCASLAASLGLGLNIQIILFVIVSTLLIILMKPILDKYVQVKKVPTNTNALIGKYGVVTKKIDGCVSSYGLVKVESEIWTATTETGLDTVEVGQKVKIVKIDGVKLIVEAE